MRSSAKLLIILILVIFVLPWNFGQFKFTEMDLTNPEKPKEGDELSCQVHGGLFIRLTFNDDEVCYDQGSDEPSDTGFSLIEFEYVDSEYYQILGLMIAALGLCIVNIIYAFMLGKNDYESFGSPPLLIVLSIASPPVRPWQLSVSIRSLIFKSNRRSTSRLSIYPISVGSLPLS